MKIEGARPRGSYSIPGQLCDRRNNPKERAQLGLGTRLQGKTEREKEGACVETPHILRAHLTQSYCLKRANHSALSGPSLSRLKTTPFVWLFVEKGTMPSSSFFTVEPHDSTAGGEEIAVNELPIEGAPIPLGGLPQLNARGRTFRSTLHPLLSEGQAWITEKLVNARTQSSFIVRITSPSPA